MADRALWIGDREIENRDMAGSGVRDVRSIGESGIGGSGSETGNWGIGESGLGFGGYVMGSGELDIGR